MDWAPATTDRRRRHCGLGDFSGDRLADLVLPWPRRKIKAREKPPSSS